MRILIIDNEPALRSGLRQLVNSIGKPEDQVEEACKISKDEHSSLNSSLICRVKSWIIFFQFIPGSIPIISSPCLFSNTKRRRHEPDRLKRYVLRRRGKLSSITAPRLTFILLCSFSFFSSNLKHSHFPVPVYRKA